MNRFFGILCFVLISLSSLAQTNVKMGDTRHGFLIEVTWANTSIGGTRTIRLGPDSKSKLIEGTRKAIEWANLNMKHRKNFTKEITRFPVMELQTYKQFGYHTNFTNTAKVIYTGSEHWQEHSFGGLTLADAFLDRVKIQVDFNGLVIDYLEMELNQLDIFLRLLEGRKVDNSINQIFKN